MNNELQSQPTTDVTLPVKLEPLVALIQEHAPKMVKGRDRTLQVLGKIQTITSKEEAEETNALLVKVRNTTEKVEKMRKEITGPLDELKKFLMVYEKEMGDESNRVRKEIGKFQQAELDAIRKVEEEARKKREKEDYKIELTVAIRKRLNDMAMERVVGTEEYSAKFFEEATLENFEEKVKFFSSIKPNLQQKFYDECFNIAYDAKKISSDEFKDFIESTAKVAEDYEKWKTIVVDGIVPVLNQWRGQIPEIKQKKVELSEAEDKEAVRALQKKQADEEAARKKAEHEALQKQKDKELAEQAEMDKMENSFTEQIAVQNLGEKGPVKKVLKFNDPSKMLKAFSTIIYHVMTSPKFAGIQKREVRTKELVFDDSGRPEYIDQIQWWINQFMANCDATIDGTEILEDTKVIVRKK